MHEEISQELEKTLRKRDEVKNTLKVLQEGNPQNTYEIMITRDRLAYWEGKAEGLQFALDRTRGKG